VVPPSAPPKAAPPPAAPAPAPAPKPVTPPPSITPPEPPRPRNPFEPIDQGPEVDQGPLRRAINQAGGRATGATVGNVARGISGVIKEGYQGDTADWRTLAHAAANAWLKQYESNPDTLRQSERRAYEQDPASLHRSILSIDSPYSDYREAWIGAYRNGQLVPDADLFDADLRGLGGTDYQSPFKTEDHASVTDQGDQGDQGTQMPPSISPPEPDLTGPISTVGSTLGAQPSDTTIPPPPPPEPDTIYGDNEPLMMRQPLDEPMDTGEPTDQVADDGNDQESDQDYDDGSDYTNQDYSDEELSNDYGDEGD